MLKKINSITDPKVFWTSNILVFILIGFTVIFGESFVDLTNSFKSIILENFGWAYIIPIIWVIFYLIKIYIHHGNVRIGGEDARPEFSTFSWVSMLFSAGLGIGLFYSGVYEPMSHFFDAPYISDLTGYKKFVGALDVTFFHWGLPAWVLYSATGLMFAYTGFNLKKPFIYASYIPEKFKLTRYFVNVFAVISILLGVIIAFTMGVEQMNAGLNEIFPQISVSKSTQVFIILIITAIATLSVLSGLNRGIRFLSEINIWLALILFVLVALSCVSIPLVLDAFIQALGSHIGNFISELTYTSAFEDKTWISNWTILYWAWWASWTPFVGLFIARISKGRTVKEFLFYTIFVPCMMCFVWFTVFGVAGYQLHANGVADFLVLMKETPHKSLFVVLNQSFSPILLSTLSIICVMIFYITSSDSGSYIVDTISSGGKKAPHSYLKVYWSAIEGLLAIVLLIFGGVLFVKNLVIIFSLPIIYYLCFGVYKLNTMMKRDKI